MTRGRGSSSSSTSSARSRSGSGSGNKASDSNSNVVSIQSADHEAVVAEAVGRARECHQGSRADRFGRSSADLTFHFAGSRATVRAHRWAMGRACRLSF